MIGLWSQQSMTSTSATNIFIWCILTMRSQWKVFSLLEVCWRAGRSWMLWTSTKALETWNWTFKTFIKFQSIFQKNLERSSSLPSSISPLHPCNGSRHSFLLFLHEVLGNWSNIQSSSRQLWGLLVVGTDAHFCLHKSNCNGELLNYFFKLLL